MFSLESPAVWLGHAVVQLGSTAGHLEVGGFGLVLAQVVEPDETRQAITLLVAGLIGIAVLLTALTVWYWYDTSPARQYEPLAPAPEPSRSSVDPAHFASPPAQFTASPPAHFAASPPVPEPAVAAPVLARPPADDSPVDPPVPTTGRPVSNPAPVTVPTAEVPLSAPPVVPIEADPVAPPLATEMPDRSQRTDAEERAVAPVAEPSPRPAIQPPSAPESTGGQEGLSDDAWASVMQSAFAKLNR